MCSVISNCGSLGLEVEQKVGAVLATVQARQGVCPHVSEHMDNHVLLLFSLEEKILVETMLPNVRALLATNLIRFWRIVCITLSVYNIGKYFCTILVISLYCGL